MTITYLIIAAAVLFIVVVAMQPSNFSVSRSTTVAAPSEIVFEQVNDLHKWQARTPWAKLDPKAKIVYEGPVAGTGAAFAWSGNMQVCQGDTRVTERRAKEAVRAKLGCARAEQ